MVGGLGGGWQGGGWQGGGWQGGGWQGGGWQGGGWAGGGGSEGLYAMRTDRPLVAEDVSLPPPADGNLAPTFPLKAWDNDLFALTFLGDFFTAVVAGKTWVGASSWETDIITALTPFPNVVVPPAVATPADDSIDDLRILAVTERPEAMGEILNQHQNQQLCFMQLLMMTATSHPAHIFRDETGCPRRRGGDDASEASLQQTTAHAILSNPVPAGARARPFGLSGRPRAHRAADRERLDRSDEKGTPPASPYRRSLLKLAANIGLNRVIAGFHFRSDISAGVTAADRTYQFLSGMPAGAPTPPHFSFASAMTAAKGEWP